MKRNNIHLYFSAIALAAGFAACTQDDGPKAEDSFLNYEIPDIPVTENCIVGAYYYDLGADGLNDAQWERLTGLVFDHAQSLYSPGLKPVVGNFKHHNTDYTNAAYLDEEVKVFQQEVDWAVEAGLDFIVLPSIGEDVNKLYPNNLSGNSLKFIDLFTGRLGTDSLPANQSAGSHVDLKGLKYVLMMDAGSINSGLKEKPLEDIEPTVIEGDTVSRLQRYYDDIKRISDYFSDENYYTVDGKPMIIIRSAHETYVKDTKAMYDGMRKYIKDYTGKDMYIIAQQPSWTPAARFQMTFGDGEVDAVTIRNEAGMYSQTDRNRTLMYPQMIDQNWKLNKDFFMGTWGEDFIPVVSPAYDRWIDSGGNYDHYVVQRDEQTFNTYCNVAKMNLGTRRMVIIDSFNNWKYDTAIEPADPEYGKGYGTKYLELVRGAFKVD